MRIKEISASTRVDLQFKNKIFEQAELSLKKLNAKKNADSDTRMLEESTKADIMLKSARPNANFTFEVSTKVNKLKSLEESIQRLSTESYSGAKLENKLGYDYQYLKHLAENSFKVQESKDLFMGLVEEALIQTANLYKETNVTPRLMSLAINEDLTEAENITIYENALTHSLEKNFRIPLLQGTLLQENEDEVRSIIKKSVDNGMNDLGEIDPGEMATYLPFQNTVKDHVSETLVPDAAMGKVEDFNNAQDETYNQFEGNAPAVLAKLDTILDKISTMLAPALFKDKVDMGEDSFDGTKYAMMKAVTSMGDSAEDDSSPCAMAAGEAGEAPGTSDEIIGLDGELAEDAGETDIDNEADAIDDAIDTGKVDDAVAEIQGEAGEAVPLPELDGSEEGDMDAAEAEADIVKAEGDADEADMDLADAELEGDDEAATEAKSDKVEAEDDKAEAKDDKDTAEDKAEAGEAEVEAKEMDEELEAGIKVEMEHTEDEDEAKKIAQDHLDEDPEYYTNLENDSKEDLDKDGTPDVKEPHGKDSDNDGDPVDEDDKDKSHGEKGKNPFAK